MNRKSIALPLALLAAPVAMPLSARADEPLVCNIHALTDSEREHHLERGRKLLGSLRAAHLRDEQSVNLHRQAQADLARLGEDITALDIDSLIPIASAAAKDAYARAVVCYRDAQQRLRQRDDAYQFEHAQESLRRGALHMRAAERLCDGADAALAKLTKLHEQGALTDVEFGQEKRKLAAE